MLASIPPGFAPCRLCGETLTNAFLGVCKLCQETRSIEAGKMEMRIRAERQGK